MCSQYASVFSIHKCVLSMQVLYLPGCKIDFSRVEILLGSVCKVNNVNIDVIICSQTWIHSFFFPLFDAEKAMSYSFAYD